MSAPLPMPAVGTIAEVRAAAHEKGLSVVGAFHPGPEDGAPAGIGTLALLGPEGPGMWAAFGTASESGDDLPDPLDRWSRRVIDGLAVQLGAVALYPFGGPPWHPFQAWARLAEGAVASPVGMQASPSRGLWASWRGALGFAGRLAGVTPPGPNPCLCCPAPCLTACPVDAFAGGAYDVPACTAHVLSPAGAACRDGCLVRAACPAGAGLGLPMAERAFHMAAFLRANG